MSPPIEYRTLVGSYIDPSGAAVEGQLRFIPSTTVFDSSGNVVVPPFPVFVTLEPDGSFEVELACTDLVDVSPSGWSWTLSELIPNGQEYEFQIPEASPPTAALADLLPALVTQPLYSYATSAALAALDARVVTVEAQGAVTFAAIGIHPFLLAGM